MMTPFLKRISEGLSDQLVELCSHRVFGESEMIFSEGDTAGFLPIVGTGKVKMIRYPDDGKEIILGIFHSGDAFAIPPALDGKRFPATAVAMEESELMLLDRKDFSMMMRSSDEFSSAILDSMCTLLRDRTESVKIHSTSSADARVAQVLLKLASDSRQDWPVRIALRRQDIAEIAGLTTETTIRAIRKLSVKGLVRIEHGKIFIDEDNSLDQVA